jgi:hypothetical protein
LNWRKLIAIILVCAAGYFLYSQIRARFYPNNRITLPESIAWMTTYREASKPITTVVTVLHGDRWRIEASAPKPGLFVAVFDGSQFASSRPKATAETTDPRPGMRQLLAPLNHTPPEATEQHYGHTCWRFIGASEGKSLRIWVDTQTRFPVFMEGTDPNGIHFEMRFSLLQINPANDSGEIFSTHAIAPMFSQFLTQ